MDGSLIQRLAEEKDVNDQQVHGLGALKDIRTEVILLQTKQKPREATVVLMKDNWTKTKKALMMPKVACPKTL